MNFVDNNEYTDQNATIDNLDAVRDASDDLLPVENDQSNVPMEESRFQSADENQTEQPLELSISNQSIPSSVPQGTVESQKFLNHNSVQIVSGSKSEEKNSTFVIRSIWIYF